MSKRYNKNNGDIINECKCLKEVKRRIRNVFQISSPVTMATLWSVVWCRMLSTMYISRFRLKSYNKRLHTNSFLVWILIDPAVVAPVPLFDPGKGSTKLNRFIIGSTLSIFKFNYFLELWHTNGTFGIGVMTVDLCIIH